MTIDNPTVRDVSASEARALESDGALLIDVRERHEWQAGHIPGSVLASLGRFDPRQVPADRQVVMVCRSGNRSRIAAEMLVAAGHHAVVNLAGGVVAWYEAGLPLTTDDDERMGVGS